MSYYDEKKIELQKLLYQLKEAGEIFDSEWQRLEKGRKAIDQLARERQTGFPWLAKAYEEYFKLQDQNMVDFLQHKNQPAIQGAQIVKEYSRLSA